MQLPHGGANSFVSSPQIVSFEKLKRFWSTRCCLYPASLYMKLFNPPYQVNYSIFPRKLQSLAYLSFFNILLNEGRQKELAAVVYSRLSW